MNKLTPEQLKDIIKLQPLFKSRMGERQEGDGLLLPDGNLDYITDGDLMAWRMIPKSSDAFDDCLRIPKPIDWQNPDRGLWGMIDSDEIKLEKFTSSMEDVHYFLAIGDRKVIIESNLFTALLKALCEQEEV